MKVRLLSAVVVAAAATIAAFGVASAGPENSPQADIIELNCEEIGMVSVAVVGGGAFSPGHVVDSNAVLIPVKLEVTVTFTPTEGGEPEVFQEASERRAPPNVDLLDCTFEQSGSEEGGTFELEGAVTVYVVGDVD